MLIEVWNSKETDVVGLLEESDIRRLLSRRVLTVRRGRSKASRRVLCVDDTLDAKGEKKLHIPKRLDPIQKPWFREHIGDVYRVYTHHAARCAAHYDGRPLPSGMKVLISAKAL